MTTLFDYIYYRVYVFFKDKGDPVPETKGHLVLSLLQFLIILDIVIMIGEFFPFPTPSKLFGLPIILLIGGYNWYKYENKIEFSLLDDRWKNDENAVKQKRGVLLVFCLLAAFLIPIVTGYINHNT